MPPLLFIQMRIHFESNQTNHELPKDFYVVHVSSFPARLNLQLQDGAVGTSFRKPAPVSVSLQVEACVAADMKLG